MRIAVIDDTIGIRTIYEDMFFMHSVDFYDRIADFKANNKSQWKVVIIAHRLGAEDWKEVYKELEGDPLVIVTATYPKEFYKKEFPNSLYKSLEDIKKYDNVIQYKKDDYEKISRSVEIEALRAKHKLI